MKPKSKEQLVRKPKTSGYKSTPHMWGWSVRDLPPFTLLTAQVMQLDPTIRLGLAMRAAPLCAVEFAYQEGEEWKPGIEAEDPMIAAFVERNIKRLWRDYVKGLLEAQKWGWAAAEVVFKRTANEQVEVAGLLHRQANDCRVITQGGAPAGVRFQNVKGADNDRIDLCFPYCVWHAFRPEAGQFYGVPILKGAYSPWWDKWMDGGALDVRRLFMHKDAYGGVDVSYPEGYTEIPVTGSDTTRSVPNRDIAREMAEQIKAGGVTSRPSTLDANGKEQWTITRAVVPSNPAHILQYPKDLDTDILRGLEIPDDVLESTDGAGGAWAGKTVPQGAFYTGLELWLRDIIVTLKTQVMDHLVRLNFGRNAWYEITTKPLGLQATEQQGKDKTPQAAPQFGGQDPLRMSLEAIGRGAIEAGPFVRAARKVRRVRMSKDESGHEHKGKGEGGGQFVKGAGSGDDAADAKAAFRKRMEGVSSQNNAKQQASRAAADHIASLNREGQESLAQERGIDTSKRDFDWKRELQASLEAKPADQGKTGEKTPFHALQEKHPELLKYAQSFDAIPKTKGGTVKHLNPRQTEIYNDLAKAKSAGEITKEEWLVGLAAIKEMDDNTAQIGRRATGGVDAKRLAIGDDEPHQFSSTQFNLPGDLALEVRRLGERIAADDLADDGREQNPHVTVKFGLHTDSADDVRTIVEALPPVAVQLGKASVFSSEAYDVVKIEIDSKGLHELNAAISELPNGDVHPDYKPHCTIAYVRPGLGEMYAARLNDLEGRVVVFDRLIFSDKSRVHTAILLTGKPKRFALNGKRRPARAANH